MKIFASILTATFFSTAVFAANACDQTALDIAKMNMDSKAKAYSFESSDIMASSLRKISSANSGEIKYSVTGFIYKAQYSIELKLDSSCGIQSVSINEDL